MVRVIGVGAGGHAKVVIDMLRLIGGFTIVGLLDADPKLQGSHVLDVPILGNDSLLPELKAQGISQGFIGVGSVGRPDVRVNVWNSLERLGFDVVTAIHPSAIVSSSAVLGRGVMVMPGAIVGAGATVGENVIINTAAVVEHDCVIERHAHLATASRLGGAVHVGEGAHIGIGATVIQSVRVEADAVIGAGAVVIRDVAAGATVAGVPARPIHG